MLYSYITIQAMFVMMHSIPPEDSTLSIHMHNHRVSCTPLTFSQTTMQTAVMWLIILTDKGQSRWCAHSTWSVHTHTHRVSCTPYQTIMYGLLYWSQLLIRVWLHYYGSNHNCSISLNINSLQCDGVWKFLVGTDLWKLSQVYKCNNSIILNENLDLFADINIIQVSNLTKLQG